MFKQIQAFCVVLLGFASPFAYSYVGPGAGLSAIGSILTFVGAILLLLIGFVWYPVKRLVKRLSMRSGAIDEVELTTDLNKESNE